MTVQILILITFWMIACAFCAAVGFLVGQRKHRRAKPPKPTEQQVRNARRAEQERNNMLSYSGDEQNDIDV